MIAPQLAGNLLGSETSDFILAEWSDAGGPPGPPRCSSSVIDRRCSELRRLPSHALFTRLAVLGLHPVRHHRDDVASSVGAAVGTWRTSPSARR